MYNIFINNNDTHRSILFAVIGRLSYPITYLVLTAVNIYTGKYNPYDIIILLLCVRIYTYIL